MNEIISAAAQSIVKEKIKHGGNALAGITGQFVLPEWLTLMGAFATLLVSCLICFKVLIEIRTAKMNEERARIALAHESNRSSDKV